MNTRSIQSVPLNAAEKESWRWLITHETYADFSTSTSPALERAVIEGKSPDTVVLSIFPKDSVTVGVLDDPEKACDLAFCREHGILVRRRNTTGGAIYAGAGSGIVCYYMSINHSWLPKSVGEAFPRILGGFAEAVRHLFHINALYRPVNDVEVEGKKLMASSCKIESEVLIFRNVINIRDMDKEKAARALPVPPEKVQDKRLKTLQDRISSLEREAGRTIRQEEIETLALRAVEEAFGSAPLVPGLISPLENDFRKEYQEAYTADSWFYANSEATRFRSHYGDATRVEARRKAPAGLIRAVVLRRRGVILDIIITGDFHPRPHTLLSEMEDALRGAPLDPLVIRHRIEQLYSRPGVEVVGVSVEDLVYPVVKAAIGDVE